MKTIKYLAVAIFSMIFMTSNISAQNMNDFKDRSKNFFKDRVVFELRAKFDKNLCLAIKGGKAMAKTEIITLYCNGQNYQKWIYNWSDNTIRSMANRNICLVASSLENEVIINAEAYLNVNSCINKDAQQWGINKDGVIYLASSPNLVMDVKGFEFGSSKSLIIWPFKNLEGKNTNQHWEIQEN